MTTMAAPHHRKALLDRDRQFFDALIAGDAARLHDLLADSFILVGIDDGSIVPRAVLLDLVSSGALAFPEIESFPDEAVVRRIGEVGIIVGRTSMTFTAPDGTSFASGSRYTHVFAVGLDGTWRLVSAQGTQIKPGS